MARINQFTRTVLMDRANAGNIGASFAAGGGNAARGYEQAAQRNQKNAAQVNALLADEAQQKAAERRVNSAAKVNELQRKRIEYQQEQQLNRQANPTGFAKEFDEWHLKQVADFEASLGEDGDDSLDLDYLRQAMDSDRTSVYNANTNWETDRRIKNTFSNTEQNVEAMNVNFMLSNPTWNDFVGYQSKVRDYVNEVGGAVLAPEDKIKLYEYGIDNAANAFFDAQLQQNPRAVKRIIEYGKGGQDAIIDFVMYDIEGGGKYVNDGGGKAKYGINSEANKDVDVKGLTADSAKDIYKSRYWDKRLDDMPPAFQAVAFDALVNHGNDKDTWAMIQQANGNPQALIGLRQREYARLITENPAKYAQNQKGWDARLQKLNEFANDLQGGGQEFLKNAELINPKIIDSVKQRIPQAIKDQNTAIEHEMKKAREADITTKITNEDGLLSGVVYNEKLPLADRIAEIRKNDLAGNIRDEFAAESIAYLNSRVEKKKSVPADQKFAAFNRLSTKLQQIRVDLGGTPEESADIEITADTLNAYQGFQLDVMKALNAGEITEEEAKKFTTDFSAGIQKAITDDDSAGGSLMFGVQDPYGYAFDHINRALKNTGQEKNLVLKKDMVMRFHEYAKNYESSGNSAKDEQILNKMLKDSMQSLNQKNYAGIIPPDKAPNQYVNKVPSAPEIGTVVDGYRYKGGAPSDKANWEKI